MNTVILTTTKNYFDEKEKVKQLEYILTSRNTAIGTVYDITCRRAGTKISKTYDGFTDKYDRAVMIFKLLAANLVAPEHIIDVIDDMYEEI